MRTFRADEFFCFHDVHRLQNVLTQLSELCDISIDSFSAYLAAIQSRLSYFHHVGCRLSDLGLPNVDYQACSPEQAEVIFKILRQGEPISPTELIQISSRLFYEMGKRYFELGWSMQLHVGVLVNVNQLGPGTGFSVINTQPIAIAISNLLNELDLNSCLPNTVLYNLNPNDNAILGCIAGAFQDSDASAGKIQLGAAWCFNDHKDGMEAQLTTLKNLGALGRFVGMLTGSRNIFSFSHHEYFRRVLCNLLARWVKQGEIPHDQELLRQTIENICYYNAKHYFQFS
ncbi:glucuronate isomerase [Echinimonas agarilytica]|uniref:Uronate isomerase n=1 Tax=Echinimonas agarilytica TaxID=1215918 RepID=A0AA42B8C8_9GAMM|nr:glucuronate isomerase [Echinimonas agarilytica]MCM2680737.1 glucuronate isomerase [Echinimonas agarilytica]